LDKQPENIDREIDKYVLLDGQTDKEKTDERTDRHKKIQMDRSTNGQEQEQTERPYR
jgi:hypothetical protein